MCNIHEYAFAMLEFGINTILIGFGLFILWVMYMAIKVKLDDL